MSSHRLTPPLLSRLRIPLFNSNSQYRPLENMDVPPPEGPVVENSGGDVSGIQKFFRKARGQIERPMQEDVDSKVPAYAEESVISNSESGGSLGEQEQIPGTVFAVGGRTKYYVPIESYEGRHRWDPHFEWDEKEERRLVRKLDIKICAWVCFLFFALQLDRGNISQALSDNMLDDLGISTNEYNYGMTIFYVSFLFAELPSQLISKKIGPDNWIPIQMITWSVVACCQAKLTGKSTFYLTRCLLGLIEGGFIPDVVLYLSYWYTSKELPIRLSFFWGSYICTYIIGAFMAYGILHLGDVSGLEGWRWLFALEGSLTALIGIATFFYMPPSPTQTASFFRGKDGWFSVREEKILVNRILRDDPGKGDMHNREGLSLSLLYNALRDYDMWPIYFLGLIWGVAPAAVASYLTLIIKSLGFDTFQTNLLTIPSYVLFLLQLILCTWVSEKVNNRFLVVLYTQVFMLPIMIALEVLPDGASDWSRYVLTMLAVGYPYTHAILVGLTSRNAGSVRTRTVGSAIYNMAVQASSIISVNIYRSDDKPYYRKGNKILLAFIALSFVWIFFCKFYYVRRNAKREKIWNAMSQEEKDAYLENTTDVGNKRLDFRFAH